MNCITQHKLVFRDDGIEITVRSFNKMEGTKISRFILLSHINLDLLPL